MNTEQIIQDSRNESDQFLLKFLKAIPIFTILDLVLIVCLKGKLTLTELPIASAIVISFIPILYYKYSKNRKYFFILGIACVELITTAVFASSWFYGSLLLITSLLFSTIYLDSKLVKYILIIKIPLLAGAIYLAHWINKDYAFTATSGSFVSTLAYFTLEMIIIAYVCGHLTKKTINLFDTFIHQNNNLNILLNKNTESTEKINTTINNLSSNINKNSIGVESIAKTSTHISAKAQGMSQKAFDSKVAFEGISNEIQDSSRKSDEIYDLTQQMSKLTLKNKDNMSILSEQMNELKIENQKCKEQFSTLKASTSEINQALRIINEVSEETNFISLNASIEAAKAGEAGKSFAVVALEIKKLATQVGESVQYIEDIVRRVDSSMGSSLTALTHTDEMIEYNMEKLLVALQDFDKMVVFQQKVSDKISESQALIQGLRTHVTEVAQTINDTMMDSQETSKNIMEISAVLEEMSQSLNEINNDAKEVQKHSNALVNVQLS